MRSSCMQMWMTGAMDRGAIMRNPARRIASLGATEEKIEIDNPMTTFRGFAFFCSGPSEINAHLKILQIMENMPLHIADHSSPLNPPPAMLRKESQDTARDRPVLMTTHGPPQKQQH